MLSQQAPAAIPYLSRHTDSDFSAIEITEVSEPIRKLLLDQQIHIIGQLY